MPINGAYATLLTKDEYLAGTLVVHRTLKDVDSKYPFVVMHTPTLSQRTLSVLQNQGIILKSINASQPPQLHDIIQHEPRFADTWSKLRAFDLYDYERVVLMDSDMVVRRNMDELFELDLPDDWIAAVHVCACNPRKLPHYPRDWIPENCAHTAVTHPTAPPVTPSDIVDSGKRPYQLLNSGLVVLTPLPETSTALTNFLATSPLIADFKFPDQDLLAEFFRGRWKPLNWYYNALKPLRTIHKPLWSDDEVRCLHYILSKKPWHKDTPNEEKAFEELHPLWWDAFDLVQKDMEGKDPEALQFVKSTVPALK